MVVHIFWGYSLGYTLLFFLSWGDLPLVYVVLFISSFLVILSHPSLFSMIYM